MIYYRLARDENDNHQSSLMINFDSFLIATNHLLLWFCILRVERFKCSGFFSLLVPSCRVRAGNMNTFALRNDESRDWFT